MTVQLSGSKLYWYVYIYILLRVCLLFAVSWCAQIIRRPLSGLRGPKKGSCYLGIPMYNDGRFRLGVGEIMQRALGASLLRVSLDLHIEAAVGSAPVSPLSACVGGRTAFRGLPRSAEVKVTHACVEAETCARCCQRRCRQAPMLGRGRRREVSEAPARALSQRRRLCHL